MQGIASLFVQVQPLSQRRIWRVLARHKRADKGEEVAFGLFDESDGTQKLSEAAPAKPVFVQRITASDSRSQPSRCTCVIGAKVALPEKFSYYSFILFFCLTNT